MENNKLDEFFNKITEKHKTIKFEDDRQGIKYSITKQEENNKYVIEAVSTKKIESNDAINALFDEMSNYFDSINQGDYWPKTSEYPDMITLWKAFKSYNEQQNKSGATGYPEGWDTLFDKIKNIFDSSK